MDSTDAVRYVYGYGRTKHIHDPSGAGVNYRDSEAGLLAGLCGAYGGYPHEEPHRSVCKRCLKMARLSGLLAAKPDIDPPKNTSWVGDWVAVEVSDNTGTSTGWFREYLQHDGHEGCCRHTWPYFVPDRPARCGANDNG